MYNLHQHFPCYTLRTTTNIVPSKRQDTKDTGLPYSFRQV